MYPPPAQDLAGRLGEGGSKPYPTSRITQAGWELHGHRSKPEEHHSPLIAQDRSERAGWIHGPPALRRGSPRRDPGETRPRTLRRTVRARPSARAPNNERRSIGVRYPIPDRKPPSESPGGKMSELSLYQRQSTSGAPFQEAPAAYRRSRVDNAGPGALAYASCFRPPLLRWILYRVAGGRFHTNSQRCISPRIHDSARRCPASGDAPPRQGLPARTVDQRRFPAASATTLHHGTSTSCR